ncbi:LysM peptidoglycan-binding domain-containing protein [uncultured Maribacter sp.]|uniref:LysM peptidoglycan-binding domain-containing protein n=1 Tax=uncultured Maribacter sp. TaxID=431308 RepID=UPI00261F0989|nr:LysM peptidoglycan-binding domain-containing protein [uncultured Maribacter sp.]
MKLILKNIFFAVLFVFISNTISAQKFTTHAVKRGESLEAIAKQYKVSQEDILTYNKELKKNKPLIKSTILVIPLDPQKVQEIVKTKTKPRTTTKKEESPAQEQPIGFTSYKVSKKETLYGIAKRFHITEELIKKYNPALYSSPLKKKMVLRIPKYKRVKPTEIEINEDDFETYLVSAKDTRWSIAHKYGITIDSLLVLNPRLSKNNTHLSEGSELKLPKIAGSSLGEQQVQLYTSYTVPAGQTFYSLEKKFGYTSKELTDLNPEIKERGGLKEGMILRIPEKKVNTGIVNTDNFNFYVVKPKQTEFSLTRKLGVSYRELLSLNPDLKDGLKAGMVLKLPKNKTGDFEVKNSLVLDKMNLLDSIAVGNTSKILFLLPFRLDKVDVSNKQDAIKKISSRNDLKYSLGLYSGALVALDSLKKLGVTVEVKTLDNQLDLQKTKDILNAENLGDYSAVIGPIDGASLKEVCSQANRRNVPVVAPFPVKNNMGHNNVFFSYPSDEIQRERMLTYLESKVEDENIIIIADGDNKPIEGKIVARFPEAKIVEIKEEKKNVAINIEKLTALFSQETVNWVFVETANPKLISSVSSILNSINTKDVIVKMFTTNRNKGFENDVISNVHLSNLNFTYPSAYKEVSNNSFVKQYRKRFGDTPDKYAVRGFDLTYDILLKLAYKNDLFAVSKVIGSTEYNGNGFNYIKKGNQGYYNNVSYIMSYDDMRIKQIKEEE